MNPLVLISTASNNRLTGLFRVDSVGGRNYADAVSQMGGTPVFTPNLDPSQAEDFVAHADGLLLSGGADFDPSLYRASPDIDLGLVEESRDLFELALYKAAKQKGIPILGICRGIQAINIAEGGTLHQHLPSLGNTLQHSQRNIDGTLSHEVTLVANTDLAVAFNDTDIRTNSYHHQAIDRLGENLKIIGRSADMVIEAVESKDKQVLGVQWHPEMSFERYPEQIAPFKVFMTRVLKKPTQQGNHAAPQMVEV